MAIDMALSRTAFITAIHIQVETYGITTVVYASDQTGITDCFSLSSLITYLKIIRR